MCRIDPSNKLMPSKLPPVDSITAPVLTAPCQSMVARWLGNSTMEPSASTPSLKPTWRNSSARISAGASDKNPLNPVSITNSTSAAAPLRPRTRARTTGSTCIVILPRIMMTGRFFPFRIYRLSHGPHVSRTIRHPDDDPGFSDKRRRRPRRLRSRLTRHLRRRTDSSGRAPIERAACHCKFASRGRRLLPWAYRAGSWEYLLHAFYVRISRMGLPSAILIGRPWSLTFFSSGSTPTAAQRVARMSGTSTLPSATSSPLSLVLP